MLQTTSRMCYLICNVANTTGVIAGSFPLQSYYFTGVSARFKTTRIHRPASNFVFNNWEQMMSPETLQAGLARLKDSVKKRRDDLAEHLQKKERISNADSAWFDNQANHLDEDTLIDTLDNVSDFERGMSCLNSKQKGLYQTLNALGVAGSVSNKRKTASAEEGGDDREEDTELKPSRKEALQAAATLGQYIAHLDSPFARRMEVVLSSFGHETRREEAQTMVETNITDYFKCT
ncbi:hypothetical protein DFH08DRAFT_813021 [Mycena albidolilacea]|uniref:Uncharacterized protein n=1 Tax=Mycena albidolilacea TaxID=1033008 RepID=A0AAD6ZT98_9AGAR|nr:hypothetical protein DFH08DRAFT_813021 [Mycena albidolilacea]